MTPTRVGRTSYCYYHRKKTLGRRNASVCHARDVICSLSVGFANITLSIEEVDLGDVTDDLVDGGYLDDDAINKFAVEVGGGVLVPMGSGFIDVGYRFMKLHDAEDANISRAYAGIGVRF